MSANRSAWLIFLLGLGAFVWVRWLIPTVGVGNPDIAGILYSADRLNEGLLPYRDTLDMKPPGSFFVVAAVFRFIARDLRVLRLFFAAWLLAGAPAVALAARAIYGTKPLGESRGRENIAIASAVSLYLVTAGAFDLNYTSWMTPAYAWAFAWVIWALERGGSVHHVLAGLFAMFAYLLKTQAVVLAPLFLVLWLWSKRRNGPGARYSAFGLWVLGAALGVLPLVVFYATRGALDALWTGIFPVDNAVAYTARRGIVGDGARLLWLVPNQQIVRFPLQCVLGAAAIVGSKLRKKDPLEPAPIAPQLLFYAASLVGCGLGGMRFFMHYLLQCLPALALLAAHPNARDWLLAPRAALESTWRFVLARAHAVTALLVAILVLGRIPLGLGALIENRGSETAILAGQYVHERTSHDDRLLVWGWGGWGAYYFADRRSPSAVFKVIGQLTDFNDNSAFSNGTPMHFKDGPVARRFLADMTAAPPAFIIRAVPFFPGSAGDPLDEWDAFREMVHNDYVVVATFGSLDVYQRQAR